MERECDDDSRLLAVQGFRAACFSPYRCSVALRSVIVYVCVCVSMPQPRVRYFIPFFRQAAARSSRRLAKTGQECVDDIILSMHDAF